MTDEPNDRAGEVLRDLFAMLLIFALFYVASETSIPGKAITAVETWLDRQAKEPTP